jgi:hypothetical protein
MNYKFYRQFRAHWLVLAIAILLGAVGMTIACPFCAVESQTLSEEMQGADAVVLAKLVKEAVTSDLPADGLSPANTDIGNATFEIVEVLRDNTAKEIEASPVVPDSEQTSEASRRIADPVQQKLAPGQHIEVVFFGETNREQLFFITGIRSEQIDWTTPLPLSEAAETYVRALPTVAASGVDRLAFFQDYFEHEDPLLAQDAYDEFARAPYAEVIALGPRMHHDKLVEWIQDPEVSPSRRRLYLTMLGVCGNNDDLPLLEEMIVSDYETKKPFVEQLVQSGMAAGGPLALPTWIELVKQDERRKKLGLDALVACYLTLRGPEGLDLVDERLLKNPKAEYTHVYSTIMALRFHGEETQVVPRERLFASVRLLLDNPDFADQVIPDLSRWGDWSVLDRLVAMFKASDEKGFVRQPVVTYLMVASEQEGDVGKRGAAALAELEKYDPESVERAKSLAAFGFLSRARADGGGANAVRPEDTPVPDPSSALVGGEDDAAAGFGASAADVEAGGDSDNLEIPDPTEFSNVETTNVETVESPADEPAISEQNEAGRETTHANRAVTARSAPNHESAANTAVAADGEAADMPPNRALIVGVPLAAAAALMVLYWTILRSGAV